MTFESTYAPKGILMKALAWKYTQSPPKLRIADENAETSLISAFEYCRTAQPLVNSNMPVIDAFTMVASIPNQANTLDMAFRRPVHSSAVITTIKKTIVAHILSIPSNPDVIDDVMILGNDVSVLSAVYVT
ncbi:MAG: hypothetical protein MSS81_05770 [Clostridiales bacterium]|nr:hypothetical protein [Clostridiales bacterium]